MTGNEPIPKKFADIEEASEFWDTHDAGEYEEYLRPVNEKLEFGRRATDRPGKRLTPG